MATTSTATEEPAIASRLRDEFPPVFEGLSVAMQKAVSVSIARAAISSLLQSNHGSEFILSLYRRFDPPAQAMYRWRDSIWRFIDGGEIPRTNEQVQRKLSELANSLGDSIASIQSLVEESRNYVPPAVDDRDAEIWARASDYAQQLGILRRERDVTFKSGGRICVSTGPFSLSTIRNGLNHTVEFEPLSVEFDMTIMRTHNNYRTGYRITAPDSYRRSSGGQLIHPHVARNGILCTGARGDPGMAADLLEAAISEGRLCDFVDLVIATLQTFNSGSPYEQLDLGWPPAIRCQGCGREGLGSIHARYHCESRPSSDPDNNYCSQCIVPLFQDSRYTMSGAANVRMNSSGQRQRRRYVSAAVFEAERGVLCGGVAGLRCPAERRALLSDSELLGFSHNGTAWACQHCRRERERLAAQGAREEQAASSGIGSTNSANTLAEALSLLERAVTNHEEG